jgi:hypothetical protein
MESLHLFKHEQKTEDGAKQTGDICLWQLLAEASVSHYLIMVEVQYKKDI